MSAPLEGIRVLDFGAYVLGPMSASMLGLLGADVIRIEPPGGDLTMRVGTLTGGIGTVYINSHFNKRNIVLDLAKPKDKEIALKLIERSDVLIENRRVGTMDRLGLGYEAASAINRRLIYVACTGYSAHGPLRHFAAADQFMQPASGFASINGKEGGPAERLRVAYIDPATSMILCQATMLGLLARAATGRGQRIDTSMFEIGIGLQTTRIAEFFATGENPRRMGSASSTVVPSQSFRTLDNKYINVSVPREEFWPRLCRALEIEHLMSDPRFASNSQRVRNRGALVPLLEDKFQQKPSAWWLLHLERNDVPCGLNYSYRDICLDTHVQQSQMLAKVESPWGKVDMLGVPWVFSRTPVKPTSPTPRPDEHRDAILQIVEREQPHSGATTVSPPAMKMDAPLAGIRVLDLTEEISGPFCTMQMADAGAEVIKVETVTGDITRNFGPTIGSESALFLSLNRNKKSIALDIRQEAGQEIVRRLARNADVLVESFRPGEADKLGLGYEQLKAVNPKLVFCSISPFGETGPYATKAASELEVQGMSGFTWFLGELGEAPVRVGADIATTSAGACAFAAIAVALFERQTSGCGQKVSVSMLGALLAAGTMWISAHSNPDNYKGFYLTAPFDHAETGYQTGDRPIAFSLMVRNQEQGKETWLKFAREVGLEGLLDDPYWREYGPRLVGMGTDAQEAKPMMESAFVNRSAEDLVALIQKLKGSAAVFYSYDDLFTKPHPQIVATDIIQEIGHPAAGTVKTVGPLWRLSDTPVGVKSPPPLLGQHTEEILSRSGYSVSDVAALKTAGVLV